MKKVLIASSTALLIIAPLQAAEPPTELPKEFLAQLPLLMSLSDQEFDGLLTTTRQRRTQAEAAVHGSTEEKTHED